MEENKQDLNNQDKGTSNWYDTLPEDIKPSVSKYGSLEELARSAVSADNLLMKKVSEFADNEFEEFAVRAGKIQKAPASASEYSIDIVGKDESNQSLFSDDDVEELKKYALSHRMNNEQAQAMYNLCNTVFSKSRENNVNNYKSAVDNAKAFLQAKWGKEYNNNMNMISETFPKAAEILGVCKAEEAADYLKNNLSVNSDPIISILMEQVCKPYADVSQGYAHVATTPMDAKAEIENLKKDPDFKKSIGNRLHPNHEVNKKRFEALHKQAYS